MPSGRPVRVAIIAGEASGDQLGAAFLRALHARFDAISVVGVGGEAMAREGLQSLFPMTDIAVMGLGPVIRRLPLLIRHILQTARDIVAFQPDILVTIDSPDFTKRVARRVRAARPQTRTIHWVCPSVWAWRPGRAPAMRPYIDRVLCLLPFEPAALQRLKGPEGVYIGHPLVERIADLRPDSPEEIASRADEAHPRVLLLPGSRLSVINRMLPLFLETIAVPGSGLASARFIIPTLPHLEGAIQAILAGVSRELSSRIDIVTGEAAKLAAIRSARAAIAASGTVTLELALGMVPLVAAYRVAGWEAAIARRLISAHSAILPNLVLGENVVPEFIQEAATAPALAKAFAPLLAEQGARQIQLEAFARLETMMRDDARAPSEKAVDAVIALLAQDHLALQQNLR